MTVMGFGLPDGSLVAQATMADAASMPCVIEFDVAVETAVGSGSFGSFTTYARQPAVLDRAVFAPLRHLPKDGKLRRFRCRAVGPSFSASSYTSNVDVMPWAQPLPPLIRRGNIRVMTDAGVADGFPSKGNLAGELTGHVRGDVEVRAGSAFVEDDETIAVGTTGAPSVLTKVIRFAPTFFVPTDEVQSYTHQGNGVFVGQAEVTVTLKGSVVVPQGTTITELRARFFQNATSGTMATLQMFRSDSDSSPTSLGTIGGESTSGWYNDSMALDEDVGTDHYNLLLTLQGTSQFDSGFRYAEIEYAMPSYDRGL